MIVCQTGCKKFNHHRKASAFVSAKWKLCSLQCFQRVKSRAAMLVDGATIWEGKFLLLCKVENKQKK